MDLTQLALLSLVALAAFLMWHHLEVSRAARAIAAQQCDRNQLVLLDQSVILTRIRPVKSKASLFAVERHYRFEFSTIGDARYNGRIVFRGRKLIQVDMDAFRF